MNYKLKYKHKNIERFKEVVAPNEEEAQRLLEQELIDVYNGNCIKNGVRPTKTNFKKEYNLLWKK
jgi:hypothetical protein